MQTSTKSATPAEEAAEHNKAIAKIIATAANKPGCQKNKKTNNAAKKLIITSLFYLMIDLFKLHF